MFTNETRGKRELLWKKVNIRAGNSSMERKIVDGNAAALEAWAEDYIVNGAKICIAVTYADARK